LNVLLIRGERSTARRLAAAFAIGAVLGTALDAIHVYGDVETYANEVLGELGWFVPLEFGLAGVVSAIAVPRLERIVAGDRVRRWTLWERLREVPLLAGLYVTSVAANGENATIFLVALLVLLAVRLVFATEDGEWVFALVAAVAGPVAEATIHAIGAFDYTEPDVLGLPIWLPALWANGGLSIRRLFGEWDAPPALRLAVPEADEPAEHADVR
jgi:uncharacterized protein DUF2878